LKVWFNILQLAVKHGNVYSLSKSVKKALVLYFNSYSTDIGKHKLAGQEILTNAEPHLVKKP
jgi:hypothetical protein